MRMRAPTSIVVVAIAGLAGGCGGGSGPTSPATPMPTLPMVQVIQEFRGSYRLSFDFSRSCADVPVQRIAMDVTMVPQQEASRADFPNGTGYVEVSSLGVRVSFFGTVIPGTSYEVVAPSEYADGIFSRSGGRSSFMGRLPMAVAIALPGSAMQQWFCSATDHTLALSPR